MQVGRNCQPTQHTLQKYIKYLFLLRRSIILTHQFLEQRYLRRETRKLLDGRVFGRGRYVAHAPLAGARHARRRNPADLPAHPLGI